MKINITKKEFRLLLDVLSISSWVMSSHKVEKDPKSAPYEELEQKFFSLAENFGCDHLVTYDKESNTYYTTREFDESESHFGFIDEFEDDSFWDRLGSELAKRDAIKEIGLEKLNSMEPIDRATEIGKREDKYFGEFEKNGVEKLIISDN
jgi:type IV secretory pathway VirB4 component